MTPPHLGWIVAGAVLLAIGFGLGRLGDRSGEAASQAHSSDEAHSAPETTTWTCSMHPQIQLPEPGKCPITCRPGFPRMFAASTGWGIIRGARSGEVPGLSFSA